MDGKEVNLYFSRENEKTTCRVYGQVSSADYILGMRALCGIAVKRIITQKPMTSASALSTFLIKMVEDEVNKTFKETKGEEHDESRMGPEPEQRSIF